ncbi:T9SS type B sorting domain-containing protein [Hymenobacter properus]|uniref:Gliding motility-associated C-terminal domain-containing protein n=1 Tax=Hymenobacter properus TaxID=2791026 RepID=A0A931FJH6_9BACT|nr:gliding motility-associated C-terminal domain-containing protein [Hymenobacter properus]MBF9141898.1 gliding motility-associated C-terminal domain-containing protein [Hymenobacter properus]MBR7720706.1 gliding motility-associated C-terminal domain-containing protein [Microvirga sp. SRT04]
MKCFWTALRFSPWLLLGLLLAPLGASATHIVGGELDLQYKSGSTYALTLNLYFDAIYGDPNALDQSLVAGIFAKGTNQRITLVTLPLTSNTFVQYTNPACSSGSLSTRKLVYTKDITLDAATYTNAAGYYVAVERCCRNVSISNIVNPGGAAQAFYLEFPAVVRSGAAFIDSTPRIFPPLGDYACRNELFYYDFGGQDVDGDSLVYDMVTPLNGHATAAVGNTAPTPLGAPYSTVSWNAGLGTANQIPGSPALGIDAHTGRLTVRPRDLGLFVFGVRCSEYRRGVKIGETRRDFQLYVLACPTNVAPKATVRAAGSTVAYRPGRDTLRLLPGGNRCLTIRYTDPDPNSVLTMSARPVNFTTPAVAFTTSTSGTVRTAADTLTATLCFPDCTDTKGKVYLLDIIVADNGCSLPKHDTVRVAFTAALAPNTAPVLTSSFPPAPLPVSDQAPAVVRVALGQRYTATLAGLDADRDALTMTAAGVGFDMAAVGMQFTAQNGAGQANATFSWEPACDAVATAGEDGGLLVRFRLAEAGPCVPVPQERLIRFEVVPAAQEQAFLPPNIITPNGDGQNDYFTMPSLPVDFCDRKFASIKVFSRWGQKVYESDARDFHWGGAGAGGLYYYLVTYTDGRKFKGWVEVVP